MLAGTDLVVANPRRDEIISAIGETARQQIIWEFENLKSAKVVLFWFPNAETIITFLELGKELARKSRIVVGVDPDYNRRFDIETQVHLELPRAVIYTTLDETIRAAAELCGEDIVDMHDRIIVQLTDLAQGNETYAAFNKRIVNTKMPVIGVRVPDLRRLARRLAPDMGVADISKLLTARNESFDYVLLCGLLITHARFDDQMAIDLTRQYLPCVDSWAHIDVFVEKQRRFASEIWWDFALECLQSEAEFTVRYGVISLMTNFLDEAHIDQVFAALRRIKHDGYYVKMALAWLYATTAVHFFDLTLAELEDEHIDAWTRNKSYQKMRESRRFTPEEQEIILKNKQVI